MARPPTDIEPSELFLKLLERPAPSDTFDFPRRDDNGKPLFAVRVFVLREKTLEICKIRARRWFLEKTKEDPASVRVLDEASLGDRVSKELLVESIHEDRLIYGSEDHGTPRYHKLFRSADDVGELTADEVGALFGAYMLTQLRFGPTDGTFESEGEINEWVERLKKGARPLALTLLLSHQRDALLLSLVQRNYTVSKILNSPPETWQKSLELLHTSWQLGTPSSSELVADSTPSLSEDEVAEKKEASRIITQEEAMEAARTLRRQSNLE